MKIISADQIKQADQFTIKNEPITSLDLMERAAENLTDRICYYFPSKETSFSLFCGIGNNGGDGLVIYRLLKERGYEANCYILNFSDKRSADFITNLQRLKEKEFTYIEIKEFQAENIYLKDIVIDAVLGVGMDRPAKGIIAQYIQFINHQSDLFTISVDMPTGMYSDKPNTSDDVLLRADIVFTFERSKIGLFLPPNENYVGASEIVPIGLSQEFIDDLDSLYYLVTDELILDIKNPIKNESHKGTMGHLAIIAGQRGMMGAAVLSSQAAMRSGVGKCTVYAPEIGRDTVQVSSPEVLVNDQFGKDYLAICPDELSNFNALAIGPGLGTHSETENVLDEILSRKLPNMVLDADALNIIAKNNWLDKISPNTILTPHPGEFSRLFGKSKNRLDTIEKQQKAAIEYKVIIILKGHHTTISLPSGETYVNDTGNQGMATAGSGDVLTGIIGAFLAQGYTPKDAAIYGVYIHGLSGDLAAEENALESIIASDIIQFLPKAF